MGIFSLKSSSKFGRIIFLYIITSFSSDIGTSLLPEFISEIHTFFRISQYTLLSAAFYTGAKSSKNKTNILILFILFIIVSMIPETYYFNYDFRTISSIGLIIFSIIFFVDIYQSEEYSMITENPKFWLAVGILIYFSGNLFLFAARKLFSSQEVYYFYYSIHSLLNATKNIIIAYFLFLLIKKK
jgi:hypothetical protein